VNRTKIVAAAVVSASLGLGTVVSTPHAFAQGSPYGCQINPNAAQCQKSAQPTTVGGAVTGVSGSSPRVQALPTTGGAASGSSMPSAVLLVIGGLASVLGLATRRFAFLKR
jgi:hypothetical protein